MHYSLIKFAIFLLFSNQRRKFIPLLTISMIPAKTSSATHLDDIIAQPSLFPSTLGVSIHQLLTSAPCLTRPILLGRDDCEAWHAAERAQLDTHHAHRTFGKLMIRPKLCTALRAIWNYVMKWDGERKARICCNGRVLSLKGTKLIKAIYTACVSQSGMKLFIALCLLLGYYIYDSDAVNAYAQGGWPYDDCYLIVDEAYKDWYKRHFGETIPHSHIVPILTPLQGHSDAGEVWQTKVNSVLLSFGLKPTTHGPCLYRGRYCGHDILLCRQVGDMLITGANRNILYAFAEEIGKHLHVKLVMVFQLIIMV
jgi:Reverse transcriptase (RNA-dependent DNA polymerase).